MSSNPLTPGSTDRHPPYQHAHMNPSSLTPEQLARAKAAYVVELETEWQTKRPESWARTADTADVQEVLRKHLWDEELVERVKSEGKLRRGALSVHVVVNDWERARVGGRLVQAVQDDDGRQVRDESTPGVDE